MVALGKIVGVDVFTENKKNNEFIFWKRQSVQSLRQSGIQREVVKTFYDTMSISMIAYGRMKLAKSKDGKSRENASQGAASGATFSLF